MPLLAPSRSNLKSLAAAPLRLLPAGSGTPAAQAEGWREAFEKLARENAELRERLFAKGDPGRLVPLDPAYWARNPLRIEAAVLARDASPFRGSVLISAGAREGVREGLPVVVGNRLVGTVAAVDGLTSRVRLLTDPGAVVWAQILSRGGEAEGAVRGTGGDRLEMERVAAGVPEKGGPVYTVGGTARIPRGLLIGTASRVEDLDRDGVAEIEVEPAVPLDEIGIVNVLAPPE